MHVQLHTAGCQSVADFHLVLQQSLHLPPYYGANLDALWDCLTGYVELPLTVQWVDYDQTADHLQEFAERLRALFQEAEFEREGFTLILEEADGPSED
jgi:ribonuclease inhibitor